MDNELAAGMTREQKAELGCRRILRCLAHLSKEKELVGIQDLQKCYFRVYKREFNKEECRSLFGLRHVMPIFQKFMADTVILKTDAAKTGSLYMELKCSIEDAMGDENSAEFETAANNEVSVKKAIVTQSNGTKTKSKAKQNGETSKTPPKLMLDISDDEEEEDKKVEEEAEKNSMEVENAEKNSVKSAKEGRGIKPNEKVQEKASKEEFKKSDRPNSKSEGKLVGVFEDDGEEEVDFEGDNDDDEEEGEEDEGWNDDEEEEEYDDEEEQYPEEEETVEIVEEKKLKTQLELLATIFVYVRMESPLKVTDLFGRLLSKHSPKNFESPLDLIKFVQANNCDDAIIVQKCGNEDFLFWNEKTSGETSSAIGFVMQKLGKILMDSKNGK